MSYLASLAKKLFSFCKLGKRKKSLVPIEKSPFLNDISSWEKSPKGMHILFEDPRFFDRKGALLLKVTGYFSIDLEQVEPLAKERKCAILVLEKDRQIYGLISFWEEGSLVDLYFSYLAFPLGLSRELFLSQGFLKDLFIAPEQVDFILGYLEYNPLFSIKSSYLYLEKKGQGVLEEQDSFCFFKNQKEIKGVFKSSLKGDKEYSLLWREYFLVGGNPYSNELDTIFLQEMTPSLNSIEWQEKGGEIMIWVAKKIKEKNIEFLL